MDYSIVEKPAFTAIGKSLRVSTQDEKNLRQIPQFWDECIHDGTLTRLNALATQKTLPDVVLGICTDFAQDMSEFTYLIAVESESVSDGLTEAVIPAATWAVFETSGPLPESIQNLWERIWAEFFTSAPYKYGDGPGLELYPAGDPAQPGYKPEVWVPVTPT